MGEPSIFAILYRLAARAPTLSREAFLQRLVTSVANHFNAPGCAIYTEANGWAAVAADPAPAVAKLGDVDRARLEETEARLVTRAVELGRMVSALDLEEDEIDVFLQRALGVVDVFAFPLPEDEGDPAHAVAVLYLSEDSHAFRDPDMYALGSLGPLLALAGHAPEGA